MTNYCCCYGLDVGVTLIGFLHLNAALYFWARVSTFEPIYMWVDIVISTCYTLRATYFFMMLNKDCDTPSRKDYFDWNKFTAYGLGGCGFAICTLKWLEWGHPPTWQFVAWGLVGLFNWYHWYILNEYTGMTPNTKVELADQGMKDDSGVFDEEPSDGKQDQATQLLIINKME